MTDLDLLDRFGPEPTDLSPTAKDAARARLDAAMTGAPSGQGPSRRRAPLLAAAAAAAVGLAVTPSLIGTDSSVALAAVDPLTFPLTPTQLPRDLGDPVFERDNDVMAARYGAVLNGISIVTDVEDEDFWSIPGTTTTAEVDGRRATVFSRTVHNGTPQSAAAVTVLWQAHDGDWTAVTGSGSHADAREVVAIADSLEAHPQRVDLTLDVAPQGWSVLAYKEDRILTLGASSDPEEHLTVSLVDRVNEGLSEYGAHDTEAVTINQRPAHLGRQEVDAGPLWILEAHTATGQAFSLQAPGTLTRDQVIRIATNVRYRT